MNTILCNLQMNPRSYYLQMPYRSKSHPANGPREALIIESTLLRRDIRALSRTERPSSRFSPFPSARRRDDGKLRASQQSTTRSSSPRRAQGVRRRRVCPRVISPEPESSDSGCTGRRGPARRFSVPACDSRRLSSALRCETLLHQEAFSSHPSPRTRHALCL